VRIGEGRVMDEVTARVHRMGGNHARHTESSRLTGAERAREIRQHWKNRGQQYFTGDGEGI
jgi:hypothetical protein